MTGVCDSLVKNIYKNHNVNNTINIMAMTQDNRIPLNVEDLLIQEDKLFKILDNIRIKVIYFEVFIVLFAKIF